MKKLLYAVALCSSVSMYAKVNEAYEPQVILQELVEAQQTLLENQMRLALLEIVNAACIINGPTFEQIKEQLPSIVEQFTNIPDDESQESMMLEAQAQAFFREFVEIATVIRKNELPAIDNKMLKKGTDVQATRLKVVECIESLLK